MAEDKERGWLPDFLYRDGKFESGVAMFADENRHITRFAEGGSEVANAQRLPNRALLPRVCQLPLAHLPARDSCQDGIPNDSSKGHLLDVAGSNVSCGFAAIARRHLCRCPDGIS